MKYPKEYLDEIKLRLKVSQVVGKSVQLKKRGKEFVGLSPFKNEKSPSFTVSDEKEFYHCFSTGEHGNIFDFLMKTKSLGFGEAVKELAAEAGMQQYKFSTMDTEKEKRFNTYKNIFKKYSDFFHQQLFKNENSHALTYLEKRGLNQSMIKEFNLGFVPWQNNFYDKILINFSEAEIALTGLYYKNEKTNKFVDRFNSRIIFPINNLTCETIAFGGRIIRESQLAKYINSPETEFYKKGRTVFNLDKAKSIRSETDDVIIVEGYMDVVSLYAAGIKNTISNSGTALTDTQIELIWKFFPSPIICLDGDQSGQSAALRIAEKLLSLINENNKIYFSMMPEGEDPDDFIKKNGKDKFNEFLKSKKIIQTYIWDMYLSQVNTNNPFEISKFEKKIKNLCYSIKDEILQKYILEDFLSKLKSLTPIQNFKKVFTPYTKKNFNVLNETKQLYRDQNKFSKAEIKERSILYIILNYLNSVKNKLDDLLKINFTNQANEELKKEIISQFTINNISENDKPAVDEKYSKLVNEIENNTNLKNILLKKNREEREEILNDLIEELKEMNQLKQIEFLENKVAKNLDESSYSELIKLKSQLNRE
jgi:DNA primase|tara:strand:+ start:142 stop:1920 length:1779 start_codon:yes stop_codon:yes gene_type:complete